MLLLLRLGYLNDHLLGFPVQIISGRLSICACPFPLFCVLIVEFGSVTLSVYFFII